MAESREERAKRLKSQRQRKWRMKRRLGEQLPAPRELALPPDEPPTGGGPWPGPGDGLPGHMANPIFGALLEVGAETLAEAHRYTEYVRQMPPGEALKPLRPGASPPASEARLQRAEARAILTAMAATPLSAVRVIRSSAESLDIAREYADYQAGRPNRLQGAVLSEDGKRLIPGELAGGDDDDLPAA